MENTDTRTYSRKDLEDYRHTLKIGALITFVLSTISIVSFVLLVVFVRRNMFVMEMKDYYSYYFSGLFLLFIGAAFSIFPPTLFLISLFLIKRDEVDVKNNEIKNLEREIKRKKEQLNRLKGDNND